MGRGAEEGPVAGSVRRGRRPGGELEIEEAEEEGRGSMQGRAEEGARKATVAAAAAAATATTYTTEYRPPAGREKKRSRRAGRFCSS